MDYENKFEDVLGFTKQTEILLTGLGGGPEVIKEFRKRNISTDELAELNEIDLITLGADYNLITRILTELKTALKKPNENLSLQHRFNHMIEIIKNGQSHLDLIAAFIAYTRLRLTKQQINFFVEPDKSVRASQALKMASKATLIEVDEMEKELHSLDDYISMVDHKTSKKKQFINLFMTVSGVGLTACLLIHIWKKGLYSNCLI